MNTPDVTPAQYGAGGIFLAIALTCLAQGVSGTDLLAYLASAALVTVGLVLADAVIRQGRAGIVAAEMQGVQSTIALTSRADETEGDN